MQGILRMQFVFCFRSSDFALAFANRSEACMVNYVDTLISYGFVPECFGPWASVGEVCVTQGWKLHISTIPVEAQRLLSTLILLIGKHRIVCFKIAASEDHLIRLNSGEYGNTQIGKFVTIYPENDREAVQLARDINSITKGFRGPIVTSDLRIGDIVYARYGSFKGHVLYNRLGSPYVAIQGAAGLLVEDKYSVPFTSPPHIDNPFINAGFSYVDEVNQQHVDASLAPNQSKLFGPGFLVIDSIQIKPHGSVFQAIDLRSQENVGLRIIKQGRAYCLSDSYGRDATDRLRNERDVISAIGTHVNCPAVDCFFERNGNAYLSLNYLEGKPFRQIVAEFLSISPWKAHSHVERCNMLGLYAACVTQIIRLHKLGYIHRDVTPSNIYVCNNGKVCILDFEMSCKEGDASPHFSGGTPGFASPQQFAGEKPTCNDDVYSLGAVGVFLLTGLNPELLVSLGNGLPCCLTELTGVPLDFGVILAKCFDETPTCRPNATWLLQAITSYASDLQTEQHVNTVPQRSDAKLFRSAVASAGDVEKSINRGLLGILEDVALDDRNGLWLSQQIDMKYRGVANAKEKLVLLRDSHRGVAGVVYTLARLSRYGFATSTSQAKVDSAIQWLIENKPSQDKSLPGLNFGEAGIAVALTEAIYSNIIKGRREIDIHIESALNGRLDWPDITHGAAGQGIAAMHCARLLQNESIGQHAHKCAEYLLKTQNPNGSWVMPDGVEGMSGDSLTGFAHGVAGVAYFLSSYSLTYGSEASREACFSAAKWLTSVARSEKETNALRWTVSSKRTEEWGWWCHGGPGIALAFLHMYCHTGIDEFASIAKRALRCHAKIVLHNNLSQCHGLSGLGEIYLDAFRILDDEEWLERAQSVAHTIITLGRSGRSGGLTWTVEDPTVFTADMMVGSGGILHFLLRVHLRGSCLGFPLLLDPAMQARVPRLNHI